MVDMVFILYFHCLTDLMQNVSAAKLGSLRNNVVHFNDTYAQIYY